MIGNVLTQPPPINVWREKRDLLTSYGWGAGGESLNTKSLRKKIQNINSPPNSLIPPNIPYSSSNTKTSATTTSQSFPNLFSSNGWGPLG